MEKIEEISNRMFSLKKRLREPEYEEIFSNKSSSVVQVLRKVKAQRPGQSVSVSNVQTKEKK